MAKHRYYRFEIALVFVLILSVRAYGQGQRCGVPAYECSRSDLRVTQPDQAPQIHFGGLRGVGRVFRDSLYNDVEIVRCTDAYTNPAHRNASYTAGLGGAGDKNSWNANDTLLQISDTTGASFIFHFDPATKSCRPVCASGSDDLHCSGGELDTVKPGVFSRVEPSLYYEFPSSAVPGARVTAIRFNSGGAPSKPVVVADFGPALYKGLNPSWQANQRIELGSVIQPKHNNDAGFEIFQAVTAGTTGTREPSWTNAVEPYRSRNHSPLPLPEWPGARKTVIPETKIQPSLARNKGKFVFKATVSGTSAQEEPVWCQTPGCTVTDQGVVWMNMSASSTITDGSVTWAKVGRTGTETWTSIGGVENRDHVFGMGISYSSPNVAQDSGTWVVAYDSSLNRLYQLNTYTKIQTDFVCVEGTGYDCKGGSWKRLPSHVLSSEDNITVHSVSLAEDGKTINIVCGSWSSPCRNGVNKLWHFETGTWDEVAIDGDGHTVMGYTHFVNEGAGAGADAPSQKYLTIRPQNDARALAPFWKFSPCTDVNMNRPPYPTPPCYPQFDQHLSWMHNLGKDQEPIIGTTYINGNGYPAVSPWQYEIIGISACGREQEPECPEGYVRDKIWRFGRTFNFNFKSDGSNFFALASIGALAQTGRYYALTSMGLGTMGSTQGSEVCQQGFSWARSFPYSNGSRITPFTRNPRNLSFEAHCEGECTSGATEPEWPQDRQSSVRDNRITWSPIGVANCRSDVLIYKLQ